MRRLGFRRSHHVPMWMRGARIKQYLLIAWLVLLPLLSAVSPSGAPSAMAEDGFPLGYIDLSTNPGMINQSQTYPMWGDLPVGPSGNAIMGKCGCLVSALSTVVTYLLGDGTPGNGRSAPWYRVEMNSLVVNPSDPNIPQKGFTHKGPLEYFSTFSPVYIDQYLRYGNRKDPYPENWGYSSGFGNVCGGNVHVDALENLAIPQVVYDDQGSPVASTPSGVRLQWYDGFGSDVRNIIDQNLLQKKPTIVGLKNPKTNEAHAQVIVGWDPVEGKYLVLDPASPSHVPADFPEATPPGSSAGRSYEGWEQIVEGIWDVQTVSYVGNSPLVLRVADDPAPYELLAINPDGQRSGFDPATGLTVREDSAVNYYPQPQATDLMNEIPPAPTENLLAVRDPLPGTYRFLATATGDGDLTLHFTTVAGSTLTEVGTITQPITDGQLVKIEARSTGTGVESVNQVENFTPEARAGNDVGGAVGTELTFDGRRSFDVDGEIVSYVWDFGDGATGSGNRPAHAYATPGTYAVTLTVTDDRGATSTATTRAIVGQRPSSQTEMLSVSSTGEPGLSAGSSAPSISSDGRSVAFQSGAWNLVPGDTNATGDVFVRDRQSGITTRVSVSSSGAQDNGLSTDAAISADGRVVAFASNASNLVPGDTNGTWDIFVHDREAGTTERVSVSSSGMQASHASTKPVLSADGQVVAFQSAAGNLVAGDTNGAIDIYVHDRRTKSTERVSLTSTGVEGTPESANALPSSAEPTISADGRFIAFESYARLSPDDANGRRDVYLRDREAGTSTRVSLPSAHGDVGGHLPAISGDSRSVAFVMEEVGPVVVYDREHGTTDEVGPGGAPQFPNPGDTIAISHDGRFVTFAARGNVLPDDHFIESTHIYVRDRQSATLERFSVSATGEVETSNMIHFNHPDVSDDGRFVAFGQAFGDPRYRDTGLVPDDSNNQYDVFLRDRQTPEAAKPFANPSGPYLGWASSDIALAALEFTADESLSFNGLPLRAHWNFGDGSPPVTTDDLTISHRYTQPGTYTLTLTVSDDLAESEPMTTTVQVLPPLPPERLSVSPSCGQAGSSLALSGYGYTESNGRLLEMGWNFADGPIEIEPVMVALPWQDEPLHLEPALPDLMFQTSLPIPADSAERLFEITVPGLDPASVRVPCPPVTNHAPIADAGGPRYSASTGVPVLLDGSGSTDPEGDALTYHWDFGDGNHEQVDASRFAHTFAYPGVYLVTLVVNDGQADSAIGPGTRSVALVTVTGDPPTDSMPPTTSISAQTRDGNPYTFESWTRQAVTLILTAVDDEGGTGVQATYYTLDGGEQQTYASDGIILDTDGIHTVAFWSVDSAGNVEPKQQVVIKIDRTAPACTCTVSPSQLWPPNHTLVPVTADVAVTDGGSGAAAFHLAAVTSNEPDNGLGDGDKPQDIQGFAINTADTTGDLRAERSGAGTGRVYTLTYESVDLAGNVGTCSGTVTVPHSRSQE